MADPITAELIAYRKAWGYSQPTLAEKSGVPRSTIANVEASQNGRYPRSYSLPSVMALATVFGLKLALVERSEE